MEKTIRPARILFGLCTRNRPSNRPVLVREMKRTICLRLFDSRLNFAVSLSWSMQQRFFLFFFFFFIQAAACLLASKNFNFFDDIDYIRVPSGPSRINSSSIILLHARKITKFLSSLATPISLSVPCCEQSLAHAQWLALNSQSVYSNLLLFIFREKFKSVAITFSPVYR